MPLSQLIDVINERFGTDFNQADQFFFDQIVEAAVGDDGLRQAAAVNPEEKFRLVFKNFWITCSWSGWIRTKGAYILTK